MTVKELKEALNHYPDDYDVMLDNIGDVNSLRQDSYVFLGADIPCVFLTDEYAREDGETE